MIDDYTIYLLSRKEKGMFTVSLGLSILFVGYLFFDSILPLVVMPIVYKKAVYVYSKTLAKKRRDSLRIQFKDFLYSISSSFSTGRHMEEALLEARSSLSQIYNESEYIITEIDIMVDRIRKTGASDIQVLDDFARRSSIEDIEEFVQVFRACRETGGDLIWAINKAAKVIGEKITIEAEIRTMVAQKKLEGRLITLMPVIIIIFLQIMSPDYLKVMYETLGGRLIMMIALSITIGAYLIIERITEIEV